MERPSSNSRLREFLHTEAASGALLLVGTVAALIWANTPWQAAYHSLWSTDLRLFSDRLDLDLRHWVNDGLMAIFFLVVGLEIKREATSGHLSNRRTLVLPLVGALGGMVVPALIYLSIAGGTAAHGWGVPMATDIALAVGVLSLLGPRVPTSSRAFLLGLAVVDDIGAIVVIAAFYSSGVSARWLVIAVGSIVAVLVLRSLGVQRVLAYVPFGMLAWFGLLQAGVHPTLAGVACGLLAPVTPRPGPVDTEHVGRRFAVERSVTTVEFLEHRLHPWSALLIVPLFAFANAGLEISTSALRDAVHSPVAWGVFCGLVLGKPVGVVLAVRLTSRRSFPSLVGVGNAAGIGFTVALFVSELAFASEEHRAAAKLAILAASVVSGVLAALVLNRTRQPLSTVEQS